MKGDIGIAKNNRGIALTSIAAKIDNTLLRIETIIENILSRNRSTTSNILTICQILEGICGINLDATILFVNDSKAFDSIHSVKMTQIIIANILLKDTLAAIIMLYKNTKVKVHSPDGDTDYFDIVADVL